MAGPCPRQQRIQASADHFRIADLCVLRSSDPKDPTIRFPPLLCIEILSKDDTLRDLQLRVNDYAGLGTEHIWAVDPWKRLAYVASTRGFLQPEDNILRVPDTPIQIDLPTLFRTRRGLSTACTSHRCKALRSPRNPKCAYVGFRTNQPGSGYNPIHGVFPRG